MDKAKRTYEYSSSDFAYLGDAVIELLVREHLVRCGHSKNEHPSTKALEFVTAGAQSDAYERLLPCLTEEEEAVLKRGRNNYHTGNVPKSATPAQYRRATALEALFGYLFISGEEKRIKELFETAYGLDL